MEELANSEGKGQRILAGSEPAWVRGTELADLIGMDIKLLRKLSQRPIAINRGNRNFALKAGVVPARSSRHDLS